MKTITFVTFTAIAIALVTFSEYTTNGDLCFFLGTVIELIAIVQSGVIQWLDRKWDKFFNSL